MLDNTLEEYFKEFENELNFKNYLFEDKTVLYFLKKLTEVDVFLLILSDTFSSIGQSLQHSSLIKYDKQIPYSTRSCLSSLIRLEAMGLINEYRGPKNAITYSITINGQAILQLISTKDYLPLDECLINNAENVFNLLNEKEK